MQKEIDLEIILQPLKRLSVPLVCEPELISFCRHALYTFAMAPVLMTLETPQIVKVSTCGVKIQDDSRDPITYTQKGGLGIQPLRCVWALVETIGPTR